MNILELKKQRLFKLHQFVIFDLNGAVLNSCDLFFDLSGKNIFHFFDFLQALKADIFEETSKENPFVLPKISFNGNDKIFDFTFEAFEKNFLMIISNEKTANQMIKKLQQERNEALTKLSTLKK